MCSDTTFCGSLDLVDTSALYVVAWKNIVQHEQIQWNFVARIFLNFMSDKDFVPCLSRAVMESRSVGWRY